MVTIRVLIDRNSIHKFTEPILDANGVPTGETKEVLQVGVSFPDYANTPTYGCRIDFPIDKTKVKNGLVALASKMLNQYTKDETVRATIESMGYLDFEVDV